VASSINKAFRVISLLRKEQTPLTLSEIARSVSIAQSTAHSILSELSAQSVVVQGGDRRYRLGPGIFYLGAVFARNTALHRGVWRQLVDLARTVALTAVIAVPWEHHHLILNVHESDGSGTEVAFGGRVPIDAGAWGKAYFAWSGESPEGDLPTRTPKTITDHKEYLADIERAQETGYAIDVEEFIMGAGAVASAVTSESSFEGIVALVGSVAQLKRVGVDDAGRRLAGVAARASYALGDQSRLRRIGEE
jgi:DNA-binding IclR family transcriptional regulator